MMKWGGNSFRIMTHILPAAAAAAPFPLIFLWASFNILSIRGWGESFLSFGNVSSLWSCRRYSLECNTREGLWNHTDRYLQHQRGEWVVFLFFIFHFFFSVYSCITCLKSVFFPPLSSTCPTTSTSWRWPAPEPPSSLWWAALITHRSKYARCHGVLICCHGNRTSHVNVLYYQLKSCPAACYASVFGCVCVCERLCFTPLWRWTFVFCIQGNGDAKKIKSWNISTHISLGHLHAFCFLIF